MRAKSKTGDQEPGMGPFGWLASASDWIKSQIEVGAVQISLL